MSDEPIVYQDGGSTIYRASALSTCPRAFIYAHQQQPPSPIPSTLQTAFDEGNDLEGSIRDMLVRRGYNVSHAQQEVNATVAGAVVRGHVDGIAFTFKAVPIPRSLIEIKALSHDHTEKFLSPEPWDVLPLFNGYFYQVAAYCMGLSEEFDFLVEQVIFAIYDKDRQHLHEVKFTRDEIRRWELDIYRLISSYDTNLKTYNNTGDLPPCSKGKYCPYWTLHEEETITDPELELALISYDAVHERVLFFQSLEAKLKTQIKANISTSDVQKGRVGQFRFSYSEFRTTRLDTRSVAAYLKSEGIYERYATSVPSSRLTIEKVEKVSEDAEKVPSPTDAPTPTAEGVNE